MLFKIKAGPSVLITLVIAAFVAPIAYRAGTLAAINLLNKFDPATK